MMLVEWDESLVLGVPQIDLDHEKLVDILNRCYLAIMLNNHRNELESIVNELLDYTRYHFRTEEMLMDEVGYGETASHHEAHEKFIGSIQDFQRRFETGESFIAMEVLMFLKDWLVAHIQKSDLALAAYLNNQQAG